MRISCLFQPLTGIATAIVLLVGAGFSTVALGQNAAEAWGQDNCLYSAQNGVWVNSQFCRSFPDARNPNVWDLFDAQGIPKFRVTINGSNISMYSYPTKMNFVVANRNSVFDAMAQAVAQMNALVAQSQQAAVPANEAEEVNVPATGSPATWTPAQRKAYEKYMRSYGQNVQSNGIRTSCDKSVQSGEHDVERRSRPGGVADTEHVNRPGVHNGQGLALPDPC